jgi:hypothetical protein
MVSTGKKKAVGGKAEVRKRKAVGCRSEKTEREDLRLKVGRL